MGELITKGVYFTQIEKQMKRRKKYFNNFFTFKRNPHAIDILHLFFCNTETKARVQILF